MIPIKALAGAGLVLLASCGRSAQPPQARTAAESSGADSVVAALDGDTVWLMRGDTNRLVWTTDGGGGRIERWRSRPLGFAAPAVRLALVSDDRLPDLFWTLGYEEVLGGQLLLGTAAGAREAFASGSPEACRRPELRDVNGDGWLDILNYVPGALPVEECSGDAATQACRDAFPTEWVDVWLQHPGGAFRPDSAGASRWYGDLARRYTEAASALRRARGEGAAPCDPRVEAALDSLAHRAREIASAP